MLSVTESPIDLDNAQVLTDTDTDTDVLVGALRAAIEGADNDESAALEPTAELVHRMRRNAIADLLAAVEGRTIVLTNPSVDHG